MTQEDKQLLLKDLCARLSYGVKVYNVSYKWEAQPKGIVRDRLYFNDNPRYGGDYSIEEVKPYLRPMSSMTEEEEDELNSARMGNYGEDVDWLNSHHFDYRGLIEKGLALKAPKEMYKV